MLAQSDTTSHPAHIIATAGTTTITRTVTVAAVVFGPGHLGELTRYLPFELVDDVLAQTRTVQRRACVIKIFSWVSSSARSSRRKSARRCLISSASAFGPVNPRRWRVGRGNHTPGLSQNRT